MSTIARTLTARRFAIAAHGNQKYGDLPYEVHLEKVQRVFQSFLTDDMLEHVGVDAETLEICMWLHDVEEDTPATREMLEAIWGPKVASIVHAVSDAPGVNRKERKWGTLGQPGPMIKMQDNPAAILVKLCDRIANVIACRNAEEKLPAAKRKSSMLVEYREEQRELRALRRGGPLDVLWDHLETLLNTPIPEK